MKPSNSYYEISFKTDFPLDTQMGLSKREQEAIEAIDKNQLRTLADEATLQNSDGTD